MDAQNVVDTNLASKSVRYTAKHCGICPHTVRKVLTSNGVTPPGRAEDVIAMHNKGMSVASIAEALGISTKAVQIYLPYEKGSYLTETKSRNAINIRNFRKKHPSHNA